MNNWKVDEDLKMIFIRGLFNDQLLSAIRPLVLGRFQEDSSNLPDCEHLIVRFYVYSTEIF